MFVLDGGHCKTIYVLDNKPRVRPGGHWRKGFFVNLHDVATRGVFTSSDNVERAWVVWLVHCHFDLPFSLGERTYEDRRRWYQLRYGEVMGCLRDKPTIVYFGKKA